MNENPLRQYFRQPAIYVRLPSQGQFYPDGSLTVTANGEYPVLPMTTMDEITYRTPDALFNGEAVVSVIQSCMPNIRDAWHMPVMDIDTVLIAIRIATYGHSMDIDSQCPKCQHENNFELDLRTVMGQISSPDYAKTVKHGDIEIFFRPLDYYHMNQNNLAQFEDQKMIQNIEAAVELPAEERMTRLGEVLKKITGVTIHALAASISAVRTPTAVVTETKHIAEWLANSDRTVFAQVRDHIIEEKQVSEIKPLKITCGGCSYQYEQMFTLDMSNFFVDAS